MERDTQRGSANSCGQSLCASLAAKRQRSDAGRGHRAERRQERQWQTPRPMEIIEQVPLGHETPASVVPPSGAVLQKR